MGIWTKVRQGRGRLKTKNAFVFVLFYYLQSYLKYKTLLFTKHSMVFNHNFRGDNLQIGGVLSPWNPPPPPRISAYGWQYNTGQWCNCRIYTSVMRLQCFPYIDLFVAPTTISKLTTTNRLTSLNKHEHCTFQNRNPKPEIVTGDLYHSNIASCWQIINVHVKLVKCHLRLSGSHPLRVCLYGE